MLDVCVVVLSSFSFLFSCLIYLFFAGVVCVCVCGLYVCANCIYGSIMRVRMRAHADVYVYVCVLSGLCVCVCVCVRGVLCNACVCRLFMRGLCESYV